MAGRKPDAEVTMQDGVLYTTSLSTGNDGAKRQQLTSTVTKRTVIGGERAERSTEGKNSDVVEATIPRDVNGMLATLTMLSEPSTPRSAAATAAGDRGAKARHFVVVAVDFGTALSGYAFAFVRDPCRAIHMMRRWDGGDPGVVNQKTPTTILLDPVGRFHSFGYTARDFYHDLDEHEARQWLFFDKFKMTLHHNNVMTMMSVINPLMSTVAMGAAIKHPVPDRVKPSFAIFDIRAL